MKCERNIYWWHKPLTCVLFGYIFPDDILIRFLALLQTCYSFGYGFVNYLSEEGAQRAIKSLNGITVRNKRLKVSVEKNKNKLEICTHCEVDRISWTVIDVVVVWNSKL